MAEPTANDQNFKPPKITLAVDRDALKKIKFVTLAYSYVEPEMFPTKDAYEA